MNQISLRPVELPKLYIQLEGQGLEVIIDTRSERIFFPEDNIDKYFYFKAL